MTAAPLTVMLASVLTAGPGLGAERIAASRMGPSAPPPTAAEGETASEPPGGGGDESGWGEEDKVPEEGWGDEDTVPPDDSGTTTPPATGAPPPTVTAPPDPNAPGTVAGGTGIVKKPAPEPSGNRGIGLMIAAGGVGAIAWGMAGAQAATVKRCGDEVAAGADITSIAGCVLKLPKVLLFTIVKWLANDTTYGLAPGAGLVRGRYDAQSFMYSRKPDRKGPLLAGIGGGMLGFGIVLKIGLWATPGKIFSSCPLDGTFAKCAGGKAAGYFIGHQVASSMAAAGGALLAYGIYYNKERKARERLFFHPDQVRITPTFAYPSHTGNPLSSGYNGLSITGRF